jgi:hypothetical protein
MKRPQLSEAQVRALMWLPANGSQRPWSCSPKGTRRPSLVILCRHGLVASVPLRGSDGMTRAWAYHLTPAGQALRAAMEREAA